MSSRRKRSRRKPNYAHISQMEREMGMGRYDKALSPQMAALGRNSTAQPVARQISEASLLQAMTSGQGGMVNAMPRDPRDDNAFGPLWPVAPAPLDPPREDTGHPEPRIYEYPVGWNLPGNEFREIPWSVLRSAANDVDMLRRCIEISKNTLGALKWGFAVSETAVEEALQSKRDQSKEDVVADLRNARQSEISRLNAFWRKPWAHNNLNFKQWVNLLLEEQLVLDAVAIYPRMTYGGDVLDFEILDGSTIKPLLDWRGSRPEPPYPAYQQELYGFPRGEFTQLPPDAQAEGGFAADQLYYYRRMIRANTPYGMSPTEMALISARLYLKRQGWMLSEYDDGVLPTVWFVPSAEVAQTLNEPFTTQKRREWEMAMQDELAGSTRARHRGKVVPPGFQVVESQNVSEKYKADYDMYLARMMASHFGVTMPELNFQDPGGLGSTGYHEGLADIEYRNRTLPLVQMVEEIVNELSRRYLNCPDDIEFKYLGLEADDEEAADELAGNRVQQGRMTLNEDRDRQGKPRYNFAEADMPMLLTQRGLVFIEGASENAPPGELIGPSQAPPESPNGDPQQQPGQPQQGAQKAPPKAQQKPQTQKGVVADIIKSLHASSGSASTEQRVADQLSEDYPESAMKWLPQAHWVGPTAVNPDQVDFSNEKSWQAHHEPDKVHKFEKKLSKGKIKPVVLVKTPSNPQMMIVDGHHRSLAARNINSPIVAYIGHVASETGPWDEMHSSQLKGGGTKASKSVDIRTATSRSEEGASAKSPGASAGKGDKSGPAQATPGPGLLSGQAGAPGDKAAQGERKKTLAEGQEKAGIEGQSEALLGIEAASQQGELEALVKAEVTAYRRFLKKAPGRPFTFEVMSQSEALGSGLVKLEDIGVKAIFKAGDPGKGQPGEQPGEQQSAQEWPGWEADQQAAAYWAPRIAAAIAVTVITAHLVNEFLEEFSEVFKSGEIAASDVQRVVHWLQSKGVNLASSLEAVLPDVWTDGYYIGAVAAREMTHEISDAAERLGEFRFDKTNEAHLLLGQMGDGHGLEDMLRQSNIWIKSIADNRMKDLAKSLAKGAASGDPPDTIARSIKSLLSNPERARMIAVTELSRAVSRATANHYRAQGIRMVAWSTAEDDRVCPVCGLNEAESPVMLGAAFPSGDAYPPAHPLCRCALVPMP